MMKRTRTRIVLILLFGYFQYNTAQVSIITEKLVLPTYTMGADEVNPLFKDYTLPGFEVFRGDRSVYPYTLLDEFSYESENKTYSAVKLENKLIKTWVMPELRGRLQGAYDKRNNWDFIYFNHVIKPADIAIRMAWIAGGLEWNHPGGHGYTQFNKIPYVIKNYEDGSKSIIVSEIEPVRQMKWETEIKLSPGKLYVETTCRLISIAPYPVPFASSLNGAMHTSDELEVIYPKGSYYTGHGKNSLNKWPYFNDIDVSWLKNTKDVFSVFVEGEGLNQDYWGCYSHDPEIDAGTVIVADHRFAPGKKYFTWGSHAKAKLWDEFLSDNDGGYIELQQQAFWDNLGYGYAWLDPLEVKEFTVYWYPVKNIGGFVSASRDACLNIKESSPGEVFLAIQTTDIFEKSHVIVKSGNQTVYSKNLDLNPDEPFKVVFRLPESIEYSHLEVSIVDQNGHSLLDYSTAPFEGEKPELPIQHKNTGEMSPDQLYAKGKSWYQDPFGKEAESYYRIMLQRDSLESRANRELGVILYQRNQLDSAIVFFERSLINDLLNDAYLSYYYLGLASMEKGDFENAKKQLDYAIRKKDLFVQSAMYLGRIALIEGNVRQAVKLFMEAIDKGAVHPDVWVNYAISLRLNGQTKEAQQAIDLALSKDPLSFKAIAEQWILGGAAVDTEYTIFLNNIFDRDDPSFIGSQIYLDIASDYIDIHLWAEANQILDQAEKHFHETNKMIYPMMNYYSAFCLFNLGEVEKALEQLEIASDQSTQYVFPYKKSDFLVLQKALEMNPDDYKTNLYLGNLYAYFRQHDKAVKLWEKALSINDSDPVLYHNLAGAYWATKKDSGKGIKALERAVNISPEDTRLILELDYLYQYEGRNQDRISLFEDHFKSVKENDDLILRYAKLCIEKGDFIKAIELMSEHKFFPREANHMQPVVITIYAESHIGRGIELLEQESYSEALKHFNLAKIYPAGLNDIQPEISVSTRLDYYTGLTQKALGKNKEAKEIWEKALFSQAREGYESEVYKAMILKELGKKKEAEELLNKIIKTNSEKINGRETDQESAILYFALYKAYQALGKDNEAINCYNEALKLDKESMIKSKIESAHIPIIRN